MQLVRHKWTVKQFNQMVEGGILAEDARVELIRGEIIEMSPIGTKHAAGVRRLDTLFSEKLRKRVFIDTQNPIELDDNSQPQPDVAVLQPRADFYASKHPQVEDVFLLVEVADTTVKSDRSVKIPLYAEAGIKEVWLVDISGNCVEVYRRPSANGYAEIKTCRRGEFLSILAFPDVDFSVDEVLGI